MIPVKETKGGFSITFVHLGRNFYQQTLWAPTLVSQRKWIDSIMKQQEIMRVRSLVFETITLGDGLFQGLRANCAAPFSELIYFFSFQSCPRLIKCLHRQWQTYYLWNRRWRLFVRSVGKKGARESTCTQRRCSDRRLRGVPTSHCAFWLVLSPAHLLTHLNVSFRTSSDHLPP